MADGNIDLDTKEKTITTQFKSKDRSSKGEDKPNLIPPEDSQDIPPQTAQQEDTQSTQGQNKEGTEEEKNKLKMAIYTHLRKKSLSRSPGQGKRNSRHHRAGSMKENLLWKWRKLG